jgi:acyl-CoA synthetase (AMP-forming)/AMP-acid ligase II
MEALRFGERLRWSIDSSDEAGASLVPPLLMQPLVENAVLHAVAPSKAGGRVLVRALRHEDVLEVSVVGHPHPEWGEEVVAFVVAREGAQVPEASLDRLCLDHIARFKRPRRYRFIDGLPKNHYGKVLKTALRELLNE